MGVEAEIEWLPFFLAPDLPKEGKNKLEHYNRKFGKDRVERMIPYMKEVGKKDGINFSYGGNVGNTFDSHRLITWAKKFGKQDEVVEELFKRYFEQEKNLGDLDVLIDAAKDAGLDVAAATEMLKGDGERDAVLSDVRMAHSDYGVTGVPFFIFDNKFAFSGAQEPDTIVNVIRQVVKKNEDESKSGDA